MAQPGTQAADHADVAACLDLIAALPLAHPLGAHQRLVQLLDDLARRPPAAAAYLEVLEAARPALTFVQDQLAQGYLGKPLPPTTAEDAAFQAVVGLWRGLARAYSQVARLSGAEGQEPGRLALVCQRCIHASGRVLIEHLRARREPAPGSWMELHGYFASAEEWDLAELPVPEPLDEARNSQSCRAAYAAVLLLDLANPYGRPARELVWTWRWVQRWAPLLEVAPWPVRDEGSGQGVDLMADRGACPRSLLAPSASARRLDAAALAAELRHILSQLKQNATPAALGLGEDCPAPAAGRLLVALFRLWCLAPGARRFQRRPASGEARLCYGFEAIHYHVSGTEFHQPAHVRLYSRGEMESIWTFRDQLDPTQSLALRAAQIDYPLEAWTVADESIGGFRLRRGSAGARVAHGQLLGIRPPGGKHFLLAQVSWHLMLAADGDLCAGVYVLPGVPVAVALRPCGVHVSPSERYGRAFLLPPMPVLNEGPSLVAPRGWFQPGRVVEIYLERPIQLRLTGMLIQGSDFERISYVRV